jgi:outer membrane immunogenic protein
MTESSKKYTLLFSLMLLCTGVSHSYGQVGIGAVWGDGTDLGVVISYVSTPSLLTDLIKKEGVALNADVRLYIPETTKVAGSEVTSTFMEINLNMNYPIQFNEESNRSIYAMAGLTYGTVKVEADINAGQFSSNTSTTSGEIGINLGAGMQMPLGEKYKLFVEPKITLGGLEQLSVAAGIRF